MVWIMLATLAVVFVVGFRVLTSDSRRAIKRLSERLGITPMPVESMIDQFGKNLHAWHRMLRKARLAAPITDAQIRLALGFMREMEPDPQELNAFQLRYNQLFLPEEGVFYLH